MSAINPYYLPAWVVAAIVSNWAFDRSPPFAITGPVVVTGGEVGKEVRFSADVRRDLDRECDVSFSRFIIDGAGYRHDIITKGPATMSAKAIREQDGLMNHRLLITVITPPGGVPGDAVYLTNLDYICNPTHHIKPIRVVIVIPFKLLPPT